MNGWDVLKQMKIADPTIKPILASGYVSAEVESALDNGESKRGDFQALQTRGNQERRRRSCRGTKAARCLGVFDKWLAMRKYPIHDSCKKVQL